MGVNLTGLVPREEIKFEYLKDKVVGVDAFNALYQFLSSIRGLDGSLLQDKNGSVTSHLQGLFARTLNLMGKGIKLVYVFDGEPPKLKASVIEQRAERKSNAEAKYKEALGEEDLDNMNKYSRQFMRLNEEMIEESKELINALGLPTVNALSEAEGQISFMCKKKDVDFAASQDYDALLFGALKLVRNLTLSQKRRVAGGKTVFTFLELIELNKVLKELQINHDQLIAIGILCGTDFAPGGVKGIGPKKALKLVSGHETLVKLNRVFEDLNIDFDWKEVYEIFTKLPVEKQYKLKWDDINENKVIEVLVERHDFNKERVISSLEKYKEENKGKNQKGLGEFF